MMMLPTFAVWLEFVCKILEGVWVGASEGNSHTEFKVAELMCLTPSRWLQEGFELEKLLGTYTHTLLLTHKNKFGLPTN